MREFLLIFILFGFISPFAVTSLAQTNETDNITTNSTVTAAGSPLDDLIKFIDSLIGTNKIDESLKKINRASLPQVDVKTISDQQGTATNTSTGDHVVKAAEEYTLGAGREKPSQMSHASTNLLDSLGSYLSGLFGKGSQEAIQFAGSKLPAEVINETFSSGFGGSVASVNENRDSKVLGVGDISGSHSMGLALPLLQCANLPFSLCPANGQAFAGVTATPTPMPPVSGVSPGYACMSLADCAKLGNLRGGVSCGSGLYLCYQPQYCATPLNDDENQCKSLTNGVCRWVDRCNKCGANLQTDEDVCGTCSVMPLSVCGTTLSGSFEVVNPNCRVSSCATCIDIDKPDYYHCPIYCTGTANDCPVTKGCMPTTCNTCVPKSLFFNPTFSCNGPTPTSATLPSLSPTSKANASYVYFSQYDSAWANHPFPFSCPTGRNDLKTAGCGPTTISMILSTFGNNDSKIIDPIQVVDRFYQNEDGECDGTSIEEAKGILQQQGYETADIFSFYYKDASGHWQANPQPLPVVVDDLRNMIKAGWNIFGHANYWSDYYHQWIGHYFWITDVDDDGNIWIMDSWKGQNARKPINQNLIAPQPLYKAAFALRKR